VENFVVREGALITDAQVAEDKREVSVVFVLQYGMAELQQPANLAIEVISAFDPAQYDAPLSMALVGISGTVGLSDANTPTLGPLDSTFVAHRDRFKLINDAITSDTVRLDLVGQLPPGQLYDGLCKAMALAATRPEGARYVLLVGDGHDGTGDYASKVCTRESLLQRRDVPVHIIGVGKDQNVAFLTSLATNTGGVYLGSSGDPMQNAPQLAVNLLRPLHTQYRITFESTTPADGKDGHTVELSLQGTGLPTNVYKPSFTAHFPFEPVAPELTFTDYTGAGPYAEDALPFTPGLLITPTLRARDPLTVTMIVSDGTRRRALPAFAQTGYGRWISTTELMPDTPYALDVLVDARLADGQIKRFTFPTRWLRIEPFKGVTTPWNMPRQWLESLWAAAKRNWLVLIGLTAALLVLFGASRLISSRVREMRYRFGSAGGLGTMPSPSDNTGNSRTERTQRDDQDERTRRMDDELTRRFGDDSVSTMQTRPMAWLKFTDGELVGQCFPVGIRGRQVTLGRSSKFDPSSGDIRLTNDRQTISREHARFYVSDSGLMVENLSEISTTRVNGERVPFGEKREIQPGDSLHFADVGAMVTATEE
jgi:hypothetical protein